MEGKRGRKSRDKVKKGRGITKRNVKGEGKGPKTVYKSRSIKV